MRVLSVCLLVLLLTGCSTPQISKNTSHISATQFTPTQPVPIRPAAPHSQRIKLYSHAEELLSRPFRDLGEVSGVDCQIRTQDPPPTLNNARNKMQARAIDLKANAVLLHKCQMVTSTSSCHRQAICLGSALKVSIQ